MTDFRYIDDDQIDTRNLIYFTGTSDRTYAIQSDFYIIKLHHKTIKKLGLGPWAALVYRHPLATKTDWGDSFGGKRPHNITGYLVVHCRVAPMQPEEIKQSARVYCETQNIDFSSIVDPKLTPREQNKAWDKYIRKNEEKISQYGQIDQTLRNALGIPFYYGNKEKDLDIFVYPLKKRNRLGDWFVKHLGRRYLYFRICSGAVPDIEKNIVRIPDEYFELLGMEEGGTVVVERPLKAALTKNNKVSYFYTAQQRVKAFRVKREALEEREQNEIKYEARYFPASKYLYDSEEFKRHYKKKDIKAGAAEPDIPRMFADFDFRKGDTTGKSGVMSTSYNAPMTPLTAVAVRRGVLDVMLKELQDFGLALIIAFIPLIQGLIEAISNPEKTSNFIGMAGASLLLPIAVLLLMYWRIRSRIK